MFVTFLMNIMLMCGPNPMPQCLIWADQCLSAGEALGFSEDENFEMCVELINPELVR
jgi:hypothetical protein